MLIQGKYNQAITMIDELEDECIEQIKSICDLEYMKDATIRIMPDSHMGKGICIGFTAKLKDKICPNFVGVDIACSVSVYKLDTTEIDCEKLDSVIRKYVPFGMAIRSKVSKLIPQELADKIYQVCKDIDDVENYGRHLKALGSIGGGNHFLSVDKDSNNNYWLTVHCGSRNFGKKICQYHQNKAIKAYKKKCKDQMQIDLQLVEPSQREQWIKEHKLQNLFDEVCYVENEDLDLYIEHMKVASEFAEMNHKVIVDEICSHMGWNVVDYIFTHHNYIEFLGNREMVIRKGAISAKKGERVIIPLNMRDGSLICVGKGNDDWNQSAPHGAGRVLSRGKAKQELTVEDFKEQMKDVWTSCVSTDTLDEAPMAYKDMSIIINSIGETVDIIDRVIPVYNFKAN